MQNYINYHKHDHVSNIFTPDTNIKTKDYITRVKELGHDTYFTTNHGSGGDVFEALTLCKKENVHCKFGLEGYIVKNPLEKDNRNYHIIIIPKTNIARKKVNLINSRANVDGFYYKPRIFIEDLLKLSADDVYITTACVGGILKDNNSIYNIFLPLVKHFKENLFLEVQNHKDEKQIEINKKCLEFKEKYGLKLIAANDSHYIYPEQAKERIEFLKGKDINYGGENNYILDYPDYNTMFDRFKAQGVLSDELIKDAMANTLIFNECEDIDIDKEIKMPSIYPNFTPEEKIIELKKHINKKFRKIRKEENISKEMLSIYKNGIVEEMQIIDDTKEINTADYFLFNEELVDIAVNKYGGVLTRTGRGSCGSFYINKILGMTQLDRFTSRIKLYPERFMSTARLLENRALPDIDYNIVSQEPFIMAAKDLLGEHSCYPMIAYGTMQIGEAFRNVCRSHNLLYDEYNEVAKNIEIYTNDEKWSFYIKEANKYVNTIVSASVHPCAFCLDNKNLMAEYGVVKIGENICCMITSPEADEYKILKDDFLIVKVWKIISEVFNLIDKPIMTVKELLDNVDDKVWDVFEKGLTCTLNQVDGKWATSMIKEYKPKSEADMAMFVSSIRPSFNSWRDMFISRKKYSTGSKILDDVLSSTDHYILFQENLMQYFEWLDIVPAESIGLIKKISKKKIKQEDFDNLADRLSKTWIRKTGSDKMFNETWKMIQGCIAYGFCSAHGLATAIDCIYGAYLKSHYPLEYYTVALNNYSDDIERTNRLTKELEYFNVGFKPIKFRYSGAEYTPDKVDNAIYKGISSIKFLNVDVSNKMYEMRNIKFDSFIDFLKVNPCNSKQTKILIQLNFFSEFGKTKKVMEMYNIFDKYYGKNQIKKVNLTDVEKEVFKKYCDETPALYKITDKENLIKELCDTIDNIDLPLYAIIKAQLEYLGYINTVIPKLKNCVYVTDVNTKYSPKISVYKIDTGENIVVKMNKKSFAYDPIKVYDTLKITTTEKPKYIMANDKWTKSETEKEIWIEDFKILHREEIENE